MGTVELKSSIHTIVDRIQNEELLQTIHDFLKIREKSKSGGIWESLTKDQKEEVFLAFNESEEDYNLISRDDLFKKN